MAPPLPRSCRPQPIEAAATACHHGGTDRSAFLALRAAMAKPCQDHLIAAGAAEPTMANATRECDYQQVVAPRVASLPRLPILLFDSPTTALRWPLTP